MRLDHVALEVHLGTKNDEFLVKASTLFARVVLLHEMGFLRGGSVDWTSGSVVGTNQRFVVPEAEHQSVTTSSLVEGVLTIYARFHFVYR